MLALEKVVAGAEPNDQPSPREYYNQGTQKLREGKLREAEGNLQTAVANGSERIQPLALYNLGHVRFRQGVEALKEADRNPASQARSALASDAGRRAIHQANAALAGDNLDALLRAYRNGKGAQKQLKEAMQALRRALDTYSGVLSRWQRASGDFKSAYELRPKDKNAEFNAQIVDRHIAELIDRQKPFQMAFAGASEMQQELRQLLQELKKRLPPGSIKDKNGEDDDDDEDMPKEPKAGQLEAKQRDGRETGLTPEEVARWLEALRLDANRKLPMGVDQTSELKERKGRDW